MTWWHTDIKNYKALFTYLPIQSKGSEEGKPHHLFVSVLIKQKKHEMLLNIGKRQFTTIFSTVFRKMILSNLSALAFSEKYF